ncbi:metal/formaldehyde-sensitive transcriptional repressor [Acidocella aromatica]|uniref:DNA-binding FrmR family transcriptional regulator n=1 Tax=Acidocella aromatica TaxID=1303579 RepID=A0A840VBD9_9PROT|nr:metal/formaldehyde-sensitive transcriptional repressor [Acidocella aromatica]MBB5373026.1 DNA-binding FrmR family transcriptional regulator [Acidocella aromatica]
MRYADSERRKLVNRLSRIRGQIEAIQAALAEDASCTALLQQAVACRGAMDGFIGTVIEHHVRQHVAGPDATDEDRARAAEELIKVVHAYLT